MRQRSRGGRDAGNAALELVILAPVLLFLIGLIIAAGRIAVAQGSVAAAARDAARQASIARTPQAARSAALGSARSVLAAEGLDCSPTVRLNVSGFAVPVGQPASVSATVSCEVRLSDLLLPGVPGGKLLTATFVSPLDPYRAR